MAKDSQTPSSGQQSQDALASSKTPKKGPMWKPVEFLAVKKAAQETSTMQGIVGKAALARTTADNYRRHLILLDKDGGDTKWVDIPWPAKGKGEGSDSEEEEGEEADEDEDEAQD